MKISSNQLNAAEQSIKLDPKLIKGDSAVRALARLISAHVELYRADLTLSEIKQYKKSSKPPPVGLLGGVLYPSEATPWYELLTNLEVLKAIVSDTNWELDVLCKGIVRNLKPPNWEVFFWMGIAIESDRHEGRVLKLFSDAREARKKNSQIAGKRSGVERKKIAKLDPEKARQKQKILLDAGYEKREIAALIAKEYQVQPQYVRELLRQKK